MDNLAQTLERRRDRVRDHTPRRVNDHILLQTQSRLRTCVERGHDAIIARLTELDREWDIDRVVMANFAVIGGAVYLMGVRRYSDKALFTSGGRGLLTLFGVQLGFLLMHAAVGWCPPVSIWRRVGVRTKTEIDAEHQALLVALESAETRS